MKIYGREERNYVQQPPDNSKLNVLLNKWINLFNFEIKTLHREKNTPEHKSHPTSTPFGRNRFQVANFITIFVLLFYRVDLFWISGYFLVNKYNRIKSQEKRKKWRGRRDRDRKRRDENRNIILQKQILGQGRNFLQERGNNENEKKLQRWWKKKIQLVYLMIQCNTD